MMKYHVLTLFPEMILDGLHTSIIGRALEGGYLSLEAINIRDYADNRHNKVDDYPYGGGAGMVMQAEPVYQCCEAVQNRIAEKGGRRSRVIYVTPQGSVFNQKMAEEFSKEEDLIFLCGHYEGIDERVLEEVVTDYVSIGDYVLTGGELAAMVMIDAISRLVPGVLSNEVSAEFESFHDNLLEYPQYSRPENWHGKPVPSVLLSGDHARIDGWRLEQSVLRTRKNRPDLYASYAKTQEDRRKESLKKRKLKGVLIGIEKMTQLPWAEAFLSLAGELGLQVVFIENTALEEEPDAGVYRKALREFSCKRTEILAFSDSAKGILSAKEAGVRAVWLPGEKEENVNRDLPCYQKISDLLEGMAILRRMS